MSNSGQNAFNIKDLKNIEPSKSNNWVGKNQGNRHRRSNISNDEKAQILVKRELKIKQALIDKEYYTYTQPNDTKIKLINSQLASFGHNKSNVKRIDTPPQNEKEAQIQTRAKELLAIEIKPKDEAGRMIAKWVDKIVETKQKDPEWKAVEAEKAKQKDPEWLAKQKLANYLKGLTNEKKKTLNEKRIKENNETYEKLAHLTMLNGITPGLGDIPNLERGTKLLVNRLHKSGNIESIEVIAEARKQKILERAKIIKAKMNEKNISAGGPIRKNTETTTSYHPYRPTNTLNPSKTLAETNTLSPSKTHAETNTSNQPRTLKETKDKILKRQQIQQKK
jgi:hypothetical protein